MKIMPMTRVMIESLEHLDYVCDLAVKCGFKDFRKECLNEGEYGFSLSKVKVLFFNEKMEVKWRDYDDIHWHKKKFKLVYINLPVKPPFKFRNASHPLVRKWLKDNGYFLKNKELDILTHSMNCPVGRVNDEGHFFMLMTSDKNGISFDEYYPDYPELTFNFV